jgi:indole-3-glycerol phosphate synthase
MGLLERIVEKKRERLKDRKSEVSLRELRSRAFAKAGMRDFPKAIRRTVGEKIRIIAEIKKASPAEGILRRDFRPGDIAGLFEKKGASAISVITEEDFFQGNMENISLAKNATELPILRKDFIFDEYQIYEARAYEADAVLLIAAVLSRLQAEELFHLSSELGLSVLFEVHHWKELDTALLIDVPIIGINNRDLKSLKINLNTTMELIKEVPRGKVVVSESGIEKRDDVEFFAMTEVDALLIGTALMKADDISMKMEELTG